jgi:hypothetical protein
MATESRKSEQTRLSSRFSEFTGRGLESKTEVDHGGFRGIPLHLFW